MEADQRSFSEFIKNENISIPANILNILVAAGLDDVNIIREYQNFEIFFENVSDFSKNKLVKIVQNKNEDFKEKYFGIFASCPEEYEIPPGHKISLEILYKKIKTFKVESNTPAKYLEKRNLKRKRTCTETIVSDDVPPKLDLNSTKSFLLSIIKDYILSLAREYNIEEVTTNSINLKLNATIRRDNSDLVCKMQCIFCAEKIHIRKKVNSSWGTSNYYKHLRMHVKIKQYNTKEIKEE